jgi:hypoxanthine phosphoribosyltransferase
MCWPGVISVAGEPVVLDWVALSGIAERVAGLARAGGVPDVVVGVARNGLVPAVIICHALGVRDLRSVHVTRTVADGADAGKTPEPVHRNVTSLGDLTGADVLIVDDIAGSGATLRDVAGLVRARGPAAVRTAACVVNRANWRDHRDPNLVVTYIGATVDRWVIFPWETR